VPSHESTIMSNYVVPIIKRNEERLLDLMSRTQGTFTMSVDGVTVGGHTCLLYCSSKGTTTLFERRSDLLDDAYKTEKEAGDGFNKLVAMVKKFKCDCTNIAVDNKARPVVQEIIKRYSEKYPCAPNIIITRDPGHCIDLLCKDCGSKEGTMFYDILQATRSLIDLVNNQRVNGIKKRMIGEGTMTGDPGKARHHSETRFYGNKLSCASVRNQKPFLDILGDEDSFKEYVASRTTKKAREKLKATLAIATPAYYRQLDFCVSWYDIFEHSNKMTSSNEFPMSAYLPIVQAIKSELDNLIFRENDNFDDVFSYDERLNTVSLLKCRFNMNGKEVPNQKKVPLLFPYPLWAFLVDPYVGKLSPAIVIEGGVAGHFKDMLDYFIPVPTDEEEKSEVEAKRQRMRTTWSQIRAHTGTYIDAHDFAPPPIRSDKELHKLQKKLTLSDVSEWVEKTGGHQARLLWFTQFGDDNTMEYFKEIVQPLLSMRTTGSIAVERVAKPLKNSIETKSRNRLEAEKGAQLLKAGLDLRFLKEAGKAMK
jgi:hypothetical protein